MLLIQEINLTWHKNERGGEGARARQQFPLACPLHETSFSGNSGVLVHYLDFFQNGTNFADSIQETRKSLEKYLPKLGFTQERIERETEQRIIGIKKHRFQSYSSVKELNLTNLAARDCPDGFEVSFFYDEHRSGMPARCGHNKDYHNPQSPLYQKDCLNEIAFVLTQNQYGRILWNERNTDYDTGEWYYQLHIYNIICFEGKELRQNIFAARKPDFVYRQEGEIGKRKNSTASRYIKI